MTFTTRPELVGSVGMVASTHWLASASAMAILEAGGNAADAAVAGGFVLQIVEPHLNGPGGDAPIIVHDPRQDGDAQTRVICGQGVAPAAATPEHFAALGLDLIPGTGLLPAVVPGAFDAWITLLRDHGTLPLRAVLEPALHYAEHGHPLLPAAANALATVAPMFREHWPTSAARWLTPPVNGEAGPDQVPVAGTRILSPEIAATYRRILDISEAAGEDRDVQLEAARDAWYRGFVADAIDAFIRSGPVHDSSGSAHSGLLTAEDLAQWRAPIEAPSRLTYGSVEVFKTGLWGQGPVMLQQLALLEHLGIDAVAPGSAEWIHLIVEAGKLAFADREAWYGDTDPLPLQELLDPAYTAQRATLIGPVADREQRPGSPGGRIPRTATVVAPTHVAAGIGEPTLARGTDPVTQPSGESRGDTCHLDVVDANGMMISATPSGGWLQSSPTIPGLGFCLGTRAQMFWLTPGLPNTLRPGARPRTTLSPAFALREGKPWLAFGTPGGDGQDQWALQLLLNLIHGEHNIQSAIDAPAFHSTHMPSSFYPRDSVPAGLVLEDRFPAEVIARLRELGHEVTVGDPWSEGRLSAVAREDGWLKAGANPRGNQGYAVGR
ncbi:gamma-glutamyltransferase family protein [Mycetocola tolaasinivorans]|uniref:Gamma-glutamyltransferase family protein n=1 Tax=Mycetocola tolaasinivorans TaxID=76635 RepID=A0A3L7A389_9MICO|nr:gamma-glutamyltransferase family protein [Mycetocola tolaasinivorans]RLP74719.1 gamma-glutamyltransferase family protein [Mycetocola tolaasinivorans]